MDRLTTSIATPHTSCHALPETSARSARPTRSVLAALVVVLALLGISSCSDGTHPAFFEHSFPIWVDSLAAPAMIAVNDTLELQFWGYVGPNDCHTFGGFTAEWADHAVELTLWYHYYRRTNVGCQPEPLYLVGEPYRIDPLPAGPFTVAVKQPDGSSFERTIQVVAE